MTQYASPLRCGHCKNLAPHWAQAASELKGKVNLGAVDATVHSSVAGRFQVRPRSTVCGCVVWMDGHVYTCALPFTTVIYLDPAPLQVRGYPTIKFFPAGRKSWDSAQEYDGGRTSQDIVQWATDRWTAQLPPPEIYQVGLWGCVCVYWACTCV